MDSLNYYRQIIQATLKKYYSLAQSQTTHSNEPNAIGDYIALDADHDQYLWVRSGWDGKKRVQYLILYLRIQDGKIWVEEDSTNFGIVDELLAAGIPQQEIILGFHHPSKRPLTEFAVGV
jgi:XisI protein